jgi:hypothetical protein
MIDDKIKRWIGRSAWIAAWVALIGGQLHALARHATADGREDLQLPLTRLWAVPVAEWASPLLRWAKPDIVYLTYGKLWFLVCAAGTLCAFIVWRQRSPHGLERVAWWIALTGYVGTTIGTFLTYWTQWTAYNVFINISLPVMVPILLLTMVGSTMLGIAWLRCRLRPLLVSIFLVSSVPMLFAVTEVTSLGNVLLPFLFAFGILGRDIALGRNSAVSAPTPTTSDLASSHQRAHPANDQPRAQAVDL